MSYYVYIHTCPNNKRYIGITTQHYISHRWRRGNGYKVNKHFYRAIQKYGWDNIEHQVIEVESESEMYYLERYLIAYYRTNNIEFGYNKSSGGESSSIGICAWNKGISMSHEQKLKISNSLKGNNNAKGHKVSFETRKRISDKMKGVIKKSDGHPQDAIARKKISETKTGTHRVYREDGSYYYSK